MNKTELIKSVATQIEGATQKDVGLVLETIFETIKQEVIKGEKVNIPSFGSFEQTTRAARKAHNMQTGEIVAVPETKAVKFKVASAFKQAVKGNSIEE